MYILIHVNHKWGPAQKTASLFLWKPLKKDLSFEEEHALKALLSLWVFSYDVYQKLVYNVSFLQANGGDVLTEALHLDFYSSTAAFAIGG